MHAVSRQNGGRSNGCSADFFRKIGILILWVSTTGAMRVQVRLGLGVAMLVALFPGGRGLGSLSAPLAGPSRAVERGIVQGQLLRLRCGNLRGEGLLEGVLCRCRKTFHYFSRILSAHLFASFILMREMER